MKKNLMTRIKGFINDIFYLKNQNISPFKVIDREYCAAVHQFDTIPINGIKVLIDVGAHEGLFAKRALKVFDLKKIIMIEPLKEKVQQLQEERLPNAKVLQIALSDYEGVAHFHINQCLQASSLLEINPIVAQQYKINEMLETATVEVKVNRLDQILENENITVVDLLKLDAQGAELNILKGCGKSLKNVRLIQIELLFEEHYINAPVFLAINQFMYENGFVLNRLFDFTKSDDGRILQCDGWYLNTRKLN